MWNSFSILLLIVLCLILLTPSAFAEDLSQIIWTDPNARLNTPELMAAYLKSDYQMAREWAYPTSNDSFMWMGDNHAGTYRMRDALETMKRDRKKSQQLFIDVRYESNYVLAVKELDQVPGSREWVTLSMRMWNTVSSYGHAFVHGKQMQKFNRDKVKKSFGPTYAGHHLGLGYDREMIINMTKAFYTYRFVMIPHLVLSFDIYYISTTTPELLDPLANIMKKGRRLELFVKDYGVPPEYVHMERFITFFRQHLNLKKCYLDVPQSFRDAIYPHLTTTTTSTTNNPSTESTEDDGDLPDERYSGGSVLDQWGGIYLLVAIVTGLL